LTGLDLLNVEGMTPERAREIVDKCNAHIWYGMGISENVPPSLAEYSLAELMAANHMMAGEAGTTDNHDGTKSLAVHCDDRLVAALYVLYHYPAQPPSAVETVVNNDKAGIVVVRVDGLARA